VLRHEARLRLLGVLHLAVLANGDQRGRAVLGLDLGDHFGIGGLVGHFVQEVDHLLGGVGRPHDAMRGRAEESFEGSHATGGGLLCGQIGQRGDDASEHERFSLCGDEGEFGVGEGLHGDTHVSDGAMWLL